jgi:hypothetical protein
MMTTRFPLAASPRAVLGGILLASAAMLMAQAPTQAGVREAAGVVGAPATPTGAAWLSQSGLNQPGGSGFTAVQKSDFVIDAGPHRALMSAVPPASSPEPPQAPGQPVQGSDFVNYAWLHRSSMPGMPLAPPSFGIPLAFSTLPPQSPGQPSTHPLAAQAPNKPNWARRHAALLAGLAMTGGGAALMANGGPEQSNGSCITGGGIGSGVICTPPGPVWLGHERLAGLLLVLGGVPLTILGLLKQ